MAEEQQSIIESAGPIVLVTGASGTIGRRLLPVLTDAGYQVRALTSRLPLPDAPQIEWRKHDWLQTLDFDEEVAGVSAIIHLGAEISRAPLMERVNVEATRALGAAAQRARVRCFIYTSSMAVYGSALKPVVTEETPTLTTSQDVSAEYRAYPYLRTYGRTKLLGEKALTDVLRTVECAIFRPTIVVDVPQLVELATWGRLRRFALGRRRTNYVFIEDVAQALAWRLQQALQRPAPYAGVEVYNLSDDDTPQKSVADFYARAYAATGHNAFAPSPYAPLEIYKLIDAAKYKTMSRRLPLGMMRYSPTKLFTAGYKHKYGMAQAYQMAIESFMSSQ